MEKQLFNYNDCDVIGDGDAMYGDCTLNCQIGPYKKGSFVALIHMCYETATIKFYKDEYDNQPYFTGKLNLSVTVL